MERQDICQGNVKGESRKIVLLESVLLDLVADYRSLILKPLKNSPGLWKLVVQCSRCTGFATSRKYLKKLSIRIFAGGGSVNVSH